MRTVHCPLCGLRYTHPSELDVHVREDHAPPAADERRETLVVHREWSPGRRRRLQRLPW